MATARASPERSLRPRNPSARGSVQAAGDSWPGAGEQHRAQLHRLPLVEEAGTVFLGCPKQCKPHKPTASWPSVGSGHLCPPISSSPAGEAAASANVMLHTEKGHVHQLWGRSCFHEVGALGRHRAPLGSSLLISCVLLYTALQG